MSIEKSNPYSVVSKLFAYNPNTGAITKLRTGREVRSVTPYGYLRVWFNGGHVMAHRLAYCLMTKHWPKDDVDHRDHNKANNKWKNLRPASGTQNRRNIPSRGGASAYKGVYQTRNKKHPWKAQISVERTSIHLGVFDSEEEAALAYNAAAHKHFGEFAHLNHIKSVSLVDDCPISCQNH